MPTSHKKIGIRERLVNPPWTFWLLTTIFFLLIVTIGVGLEWGGYGLLLPLFMVGGGFFGVRRKMSWPLFRSHDANQGATNQAKSRYIGGGGWLMATAFFLVVWLAIWASKVDFDQRLGLFFAGGWTLFGMASMLKTVEGWHQWSALEKRRMREIAYLKKVTIDVQEEARKNLVKVHRRAERERRAWKSELQAKREELNMIRCLAFQRRLEYEGSKESQKCYHLLSNHYKKYKEMVSNLTSLQRKMARLNATLQHAFDQERAQGLAMQQTVAELRCQVRRQSKKEQGDSEVKLEELVGSLIHELQQRSVPFFDTAD